MQGGNFTEFLDSVGGRLTEKEAKFFFDQILAGINYIHEQGFTHRNICFESILLSKDLTLKLGNFGHAKVTSKLNSFNGHP